MPASSRWRPRLVVEAARGPDAQVRLDRFEEQLSGDYYDRIRYASGVMLRRCIAALAKWRSEVWLKRKTAAPGSGSLIIVSV